MSGKRNPPAAVLRALRPMILGLLGLIGTALVSAGDIGPREHAQGQYDAASQRYRVAPGDNLSEIAARFGATVVSLETLNDLTGDRILVGQQLVVATGSSDEARGEPPKDPAQGDPLPSWSDGPAKQAIIDFAAAVTDASSPDYVPPEARIATFDNDGTLWCKKPLYIQLAFVLDRVKALAPQNPHWQREEPFSSVLSGDLNRLKGWHLPAHCPSGHAPE